MTSELPVALVTGANKGIGLVVAQQLAQEGYRIAACVRSRSPKLDQLITSNDDRHAVFSLDLASDQSIKDCAKAVINWAGQIQALVNCAAVAKGGLFSITRIDDMRSLFDVNLFGTLLLTQYITKKMIRAQTGSVINIVSTAGILSDSGTLAYGGSKAALIHATKVMAAELGAFNIRANAIAPSVVETEMAALMDATAREKLDSRSALKGTIEPSDVANLVSYLVSDQSAKISGQVIRLDRAQPF